MESRTVSYLEQIQTWDLALCLRFNRVNRLRLIGRLFGIISRLGDGVFWYGLMLALLLWEKEMALVPVLHMAAAGLACTLLYKWLKAKTLRPRPYEFYRDITLSVPPLDQYSFPSGHTLHAVAFTLVALGYYPSLDVLLVPFALLVGASRMVLGLHYPTDVLAGAAIGALVGGASLWLV
jgi:undecaprenyl-diphosphatase